MSSLAESPVQVERPLGDNLPADRPFSGPWTVAAESDALLPPEPIPDPPVQKTKGSKTKSLKAKKAAKSKPAPMVPDEPAPQAVPTTSAFAFIETPRIPAPEPWTEPSLWRPPLAASHVDNNEPIEALQPETSSRDLVHDSPADPEPTPHPSLPDPVSPVPSIMSGPLPPSHSPLAPFDDLVHAVGDVELKCSDDVIVTAHSQILAASSGWFRERIGTTATLHRHKFPLSHNSRNVVLVLSLLYPMDKRPQVDAEDVGDILEAAATLRITSVSARDVLNGLIKEEPHALRSWALAYVYDYPDAQRTAIKRFVQSGQYSFGDLPSEVYRAGAGALDLFAARDRARRAAYDAISNLDWACSQRKCRAGPISSTPINASAALRRSCCDSTTTTPHSSLCHTLHSPLAINLHALHNAPSLELPSTTPDWRREYLTRTSAMNPFAPEISSDLYLYLIFAQYPPPCCKSAAPFWAPGAAEARDALRTKLERIVDEEVERLVSVPSP